MKQFLYMIMLSSMVLFAACGGGGTEQATEKSGAVTLLEQKVIAIHDDAMAKIETVKSIDKRIGQTLAKLDQEGMMDETTAKEAQEVQTLLRRADKGMTDWMKGYKAPSMSKMSNAEATSYLAQEQQKIEEVSEMINKGIEDAERFLGKL